MGWGVMMTVMVMVFMGIIMHGIIINVVDEVVIWGWGRRFAMLPARVSQG